MKMRGRSIYRNVLNNMRKIWSFLLLSNDRRRKLVEFVLK